MLPRADGTKMTGYKGNGPDFEMLEAQIFAHPRLLPEEEKGLLERIATGDQEATHKLVRHNIRYVGKIAAKYVHRRKNISLFFDIAQEGIIGLYDAVRTYDLRHGEKKGHRQATFRGHARSHIKRRILEYLDSLHNVCHVPRTAYTSAFKAIAKRMEYQGIAMTIDNYRAFLANPSNGLKRKTVETLTKMPSEFLVAYLTLRTAKRSSVGIKESTRRKGVRPKDYMPDIYGERREIARRVREAVQSLTPTQREAILLRHLDANLEQKEISGITGISRQSVSCAERMAINNLRERLRDLEAVVE